MEMRILPAMLAVLVLLGGGCESKTNEAPSPPTAADRNATTSGERVSSEEEAVVADEQEPAVPEEQGPVEPTLPEEAEETEAAEAEATAPEAQEQPAAEAETPEPAAPEAKSAIAASPEVVVYDVSFGRVTFNHQVHAGSFDCNSCHTTDPPGTIVLGKDKAHELCRGCHQQMAAGPAQCSGCHKKD